MQRRDRADFLYDKISEHSMNYSNVNQLKELILIKVGEFLKQEHESFFYLEKTLADETALELLRLKTFEPKSLHFMVQRGVVSQEVIDKHLNNLSNIDQEKSNPSSNMTFNAERQQLKQEI